MKWGDIFPDPDAVGQTEYLVIHDAIASAVMETESPDTEQTVSRDQRQRIAEMLDEIGSQTRRLAESLSKNVPVKTYWRACDCGKVLVVTERADRRASGGKSLELDWKKGAFTASRCLHSFPCPDCGRMIEWNDGAWQIMQGTRGNAPYIWPQEDESEGTAKCGCRLVSDLHGRGAAVFLCPMHDAAPGMLRTLTRPEPTEARKPRRNRPAAIGTSGRNAPQRCADQAAGGRGSSE